MMDLPSWKRGLKSTLAHSPYEGDSRLLEAAPTDPAFQKEADEHGVLTVTTRMDPPQLLFYCRDWRRWELRDLAFARESSAYEGAVVLPFLHSIYHRLLEKFPTHRVSIQAIEDVRKGWRITTKQRALTRYLNDLASGKEEYESVTGYGFWQPRDGQKRDIKFFEQGWSLGYGLINRNEQGMGKTATILIAIDRYIQKHPEENVSVAVFAPKPALRNVWVVEIAKFSHFLRPIVLDHSSIQQRYEVLETADYYDRGVLDSAGECISFEQVPGRFNCILTNHQAATKRKRREDRPGRETDENRTPVVQWMCDNPPTFCIVDEIHLLQNKNAARSVGIAEVMRKSRFRHGMSGTMGLAHQLYNQLQLIDPRIYPVNQTQYLARYVREWREGAIVRKREYINQEELRRRLKTFSTRRLQSELPGLPSSIEHVERLTMSPVQKRVYNELATKCETEYRDRQITRASLSGRLHALRTIASGHVRADDGRLWLPLGDNAKLARLDEILTQELPCHDIEELAWKRKIVLAASYKEDVAMLSAFLTKKAVCHVIMTGDVTGKVRDSAIHRWINDPNVRVLLGITSTFGISLNLVPRLPSICDLMIFYSYDTDPLLREQAKRRILRGSAEWDKMREAGQEPRMIRFWWLACAGTVDMNIQRSLREKLNATAELHDGNIRQVLRGEA